MLLRPVELRHVLLLLRAREAMVAVEVVLLLALEPWGNTVRSVGAVSAAVGMMFVFCLCIVLIDAKCVELLRAASSAAHAGEVGSNCGAGRK